MTIADPPRSSAVPPIPPLIRRNTLLLALSQAFTGAGMGLVYSIGPLMVVGVSGSAALSGISVTLMGLSRFLVSYPAGKITDTHGRKPAMLGGLTIALIATVLVGLATNQANLFLLIGGLLMFGMGMNVAQQLRVAAADMYPASRRAEGLGFVLTGSLVGVLLTPALVAIGQATAPSLGSDPLALPWLLLPVLILPGMFVVTQVRPDPKEIAQRLGDFYPGHRSELPVSQKPGRNVTLGAFMSHHPRKVAVLTHVAAQGNMAVVMVSSSLLLHHHGSTLSEIAVSASLHSMGMWAFSIPLGRLADRIGRRAILLYGGIIATGGAVLATQTADYWMITLGSFLVGVGWSAANVATTVVIADTTSPTERGRGVGLNDTLAAWASILIPLIAGPMGAVFGVPSTGLLAALIMLPPVILLFTVQEPSPGKFVLKPDPAEAAA